MVGVASIFPLIAVLSSPEIIETNKYFNRVYQTLNFTSTNSFYFFDRWGILGNCFTHFIPLCYALRYSARVASPSCEITSLSPPTL